MLSKAKPNKTTAATKQNPSSVLNNINHLIPHISLVCLQNESWPLAKQVHPQDFAFANKELALCSRQKGERRPQSRSGKWKDAG